MPQQTPDNLQQCAAHHCNAIKLSDGCLFGSAPDPSTLQELADAGLKTVVDFRPASEWSCPDWPQRVQAAGMDFRHFPVSNVNEMTPTLTAAVWELWQDSTAQPLLMHCASGNRAAAALALAAVRHGGMNPQQALVLGQQAGLTKMLPAVQQCREFCQ
ncbi:MAG: hypothetical protein KKC01_00415 [Gammaproteobacteria bacterium]|nr:hypothetical protein [Gammaproteobacteria bacterium]